MGAVKIKISSDITALTGTGSRVFNKIIKTQIMPVIMDTIVDDVKEKAVEYATGMDIPPNKVARQSRHAIGQSDSGYSPSDVLADSIKITDKHTTKKGIIRATIEAMIEYASWVEFGTGIFGPRGEPIVPKKSKVMVFPFQGKTIAVSMTLGQPPQPFMRGAVWYIKDNFEQTRKKILKKLGQ
jgi:HK97 gp10 family phage protein